MNARTVLPLAALAAVLFGSWPAFIAGGTAQVQAATASSAAAAPVTPDYAQRDRLVAFWEGAVREQHTSDMFSPRELAGQYLQRYREKGDIDDVVRAQNMAQRSLRIMPHNVAALSEMAAVMLTLHRFRDALQFVDKLILYDPNAAGFLAQKANLEMELGDYNGAARTIAAIRGDERDSIAAQTVRSRYDELTGRLDEARTLLDDALREADQRVDEPAQSRAWYHYRAGELAFKAGDTAAALNNERAALAIFPTYNLALKDLAKFLLATHRYREALDAAIAGAQVTPFAETLGYQADAQAALGDSRAAKATRAQIFAIERLGNAYRVNDRLLAVYYADHRLKSDDALTIAQREAAVRGNEIYAQDTLAWAAAMDGRWDVAKDAAARATRYHTQDSIIMYHAGIIALHFGLRTAAKNTFEAALAANPEFDAVYADDARRKVGRL